MTEPSGMEGKVLEAEELIVELAQQLELQRYRTEALERAIGALENSAAVANTAKLALEAEAVRSEKRADALQISHRALTKELREANVAQMVDVRQSLRGAVSDTIAEAIERLADSNAAIRAAHEGMIANVELLTRFVSVSSSSVRAGVERGTIEVVKNVAEATAALQIAVDTVDEMKRTLHETFGDAALRASKAANLMQEQSSALENVTARLASESTAANVERLNKMVQTLIASSAAALDETSRTVRSISVRLNWLWGVLVVIAATSGFSLYYGWIARR